MKSCWSAAIASVLLLWGAAWAVPRNPEIGFNDVLQTIRVRKLLLEDEVLAPLNLGVKVKDRVAILWGPVPSLELAFRAEMKVRALVELIEVRNCLEIQGEDWLPPAKGGNHGPHWTPPELPKTPPQPNGPARRNSNIAQNEMELPPLEIPITNFRKYIPPVP